MKTTIVVVVDQLSYADAANLPRTRSLMGTPREVSLAWMPTLTETSFASISTGLGSESHGVIGSGAFRRTHEGLEWRSVEEQVLTEEGYGIGNSLASYLAQRGVQAMTVAGKDKVAWLLDNRRSLVGPAGAIRATYTRASIEEPFETEVLDCDGIPVGRFHGLLGPKSLAGAGTNRGLLTMARDLFAVARDPGRPACLFVALPELDHLGHIAPRESPAFQCAVADLDDALVEFINDVSALNDEHQVIVTSDHGCRPIDKAIYFDGWNPHLIDSGDLRRPLPMPPGLERSLRDDGPAIVCDGGTIRFWVQDGRGSEVAGFLREHWREALQSSTDRMATDGTSGDFGHEHWGDVVGVAHANVALCKAAWIRAENGRFVIPCGEHGTDLPADAVVPWWGPGGSHLRLREQIARFLVC